MKAKKHIVSFLWMALFLLVMLGVDILAPIISPWFGPSVVIVFIGLLVFLMIRLARR
jgi:hypothetical protein